MNRLSEVKWRYGGLAVALMMSAGVAWAGNEPVRNKAPELAAQGLTPTEYFAQQERLHEWLMTQVPEGVERSEVRVSLTEQDRLDLERPYAAVSERLPMRVGVVKTIPERVGVSRGVLSGKAASGVRQNTADGGFVWATTVTAEDAVAIRVHFEHFSIPAGAEVYFFSREGEAFGPYVGSGPHGTGEFWSRSLTSSTGIVLLKYYGEADVRDLRGLSFRITDVAHIALDFPKPAAGEGSIASFCTYNAECIENNECTSDPAVNDAKYAVAKMRWIRAIFVYICTGGLIADTDGSTEIPYFLTANHCIDADSEAENLEAYFQYHVPCGTSVCEGSFDPAPSPSTYGASVVVTDTDSDFTLLQLAEAPPSGSIYLGWNTSPVALTDGVALHRISHPSGAPQAYSEHSVDTSSPECNGIPRGDWIYSADVVGATEGGSSGSPVVNSAGEIVGQLTGCCGYDCDDVCAGVPTNWTIDGAFAAYWAQVEPYLDTGGGCTTDSDCDDGDACNGAETCVDSVCQAGTPVDCDDGDACTTDSCDPATGACSNDPITCDDGDPCTTDTCDPATGCVYTEPPCQDGDGCCPTGCDSSNDNDCADCVEAGGSCASDADCCSNKCVGRPGDGTCK